MGPRTADLLRQLARGHLVYPAGPGRYAMHDLLRAYAAKLGHAEADEALTRLLDYYLAAATAAMDTLVPARQDYRPRVTPPATPLPDVADAAAARAWLDAERTVLVRIAGHAAGGAWPRHATLFSAVLWRYPRAGGPGRTRPGPGSLVMTGSRRVPV